MCRRLLSIQDLSCVGQCSLTVALPLVSACGIETAVLPTAVLSNHTTGFSGYTFRDLADDLPAIMESWRANGIRFDAFLTGYVCENHIRPILEIMEKCAADEALRIVDPAMADAGQLYPGFGADFPRKLAQLCSGADYLLPNLTEAALLTGRECRLEDYDRKYVEELISGLHALGAKNVILTGVSFDHALIGCAVSGKNGVEYVFKPREKHCAHGTGDVFSAVFAGALLRGCGMLRAAEIAAEFVRLAIRETPGDHWYGICFERAIPALAGMLS